jgi:cysteinyl-tRNA synthetase
VDDRIINKSIQTGENALEISRRYTEEYFKDMETLRVTSTNLYAKASDYIPEIIGQIQGLINKGIAYQIENDVYYDISKFPDYGKLSKQNLEQLNVHRIDPDPRKKNPGDFVLWKSQKPGEIAWESPWSMGRPGWHIEDTAITLTYFGPTYDLHGGGGDLIFPHHEAEIAEAEGLTGKKPLAKYWLHTGLLTIKGQEMHKSLGNFIPIRDFVQQLGVDAVRLFYASTHYRSPLDYSQETITQSISLARRFQRVHDQLTNLAGGKVQSDNVNNLKIPIDIEKSREEFYMAMDNDFNTPGALASLLKIVAIAEDQLRQKVDSNIIRGTLMVLKELSSILGILEEETVSRERFNNLVNILLGLRSQLRAQHEFAAADRIRQDMVKAGIQVEDQAIA